MLLALAVLAAQIDPLAAYLQKEEPSYKVEASAPVVTESVSTTKMRLSSLEWEGKVWKHDVEIIEPKQVEFQDTALLLITGDRGRHDEDIKNAEKLAPRLKMRVVVLYDVPNQPLFDDLREDALIAHSFERYLATGDPSKVVLLPMVKSAKACIEAVQEATSEDRNGGVTRFIVTGASKRGWTTYLLASVEPRVVGLAPMVFDVLDFPAQLRHQFASWGAYSPMIADYTERGLQEILDTPEGQKLLDLVDPYRRRTKLQRPKLILLGANDPYWTTDALNLYWRDLVGHKAVLYAPNSGHGLEDHERVFDALVAFARLTAKNKPLPALIYQWMAAGGNQEDPAVDFATILVRSPRPAKGRIWVAESANKNFSSAKWRVVLEKDSPGELRVPESTGKPGYRAAFGEFDMEVDGMKFRLSTTPVILKGR